MVGFVNRIAKAVGFSYDALEPRGKRRTVPRTTPREDHFTRGSKRKGLQSNAADLARNMSLAAWMVRRHLDYVAQFSFHARTESDDLNDQIERLMREDSRPSRSDIAGKFGREKMFRLAEARRVLDGDAGIIKHKDGRMQGIQGDLIKDPPKVNDGEEWIDGVLVTGVGRPLSFAIHKRKSYSQDDFLRRVDAPNVIHYGFFDRFAADQVRGISPIVSALNPLRDVYENFDYALAKAKVSHLFALSIYRDRSTVGGDDDDADLDEEESEDREPYRFDLTKPNILDLDDGDRAEVLESNQPSTEFQQFTQLIIQVALKALDIPFSFYDESHTNFFGSRAAWMHYERSAKDKRDDQIEMRRNYTNWKLRHWIRDGRLTLPAGMTVSDVAYEWVPRGMPFWDPSKEIRGHLDAIAGDINTVQRVCQSTGTDFYDNVDQNIKAAKYRQEKYAAAGLPVPVADTEPMPIQVVEKDDDDA